MEFLREEYDQQVPIVEMVIQKIIATYLHLRDIKL